MILSVDFVDKIVQAIRPEDKVVELEGGTTIPILRCGLGAQQRSRQKNMEASSDHEKNNRMSPLLIRDLVTTDIPGQIQTSALALTKLHGLIVIQLLPKLFEKHKRICTSDVFQVEAEQMF